MSEFTSPYQFVPVTGQVNGKDRDDIDFAAIRKGEHSFVRHDLWCRDGHSGRVVCRLHLETPTFVGNDQSRGDETGGAGENGQRPAKTVSHFQIDGQPAFPAASLRGMVGSTLEALSQSALRVLDDIDYSVRQDASGGNELRLGCIDLGARPGRVQIREYDYLRVRTAVAEEVFGTLPKVPPICYVDLRQRRPKPSKRGPDELPGAAISAHRSATHTEEGFLLILDAPGDKLPPERKFEIFAYLGEKGANPKLSVSSKAIDRYQQLVAERWRATARKIDEPVQPFGFKGFARRDKPWNLTDGQFVYFRAAGDTVTEIRPSQIWRAKAGRSHDYFGGINPNTLPWGAAARAGGLSPAEALLGVVERDKQDGAKGSRNLAGRVRFSAARHLGANGVRQLPEVTLKILSSPKPPSPAMYFHPKGRRGTYLARSDLAGYASAPNSVAPRPTPNGRKVYVHHRPNDIDVAQQVPWRSHSDERDNQKLRVAPLDAGQDFFFHVDFDNLSHDELDLLLAALKPAPQHQHRLGLGKALGLGSVSLDIAAVCLRDTAGRYTAEGLTRPRYRLAWREHEDDAWQQRYAPEWQAAGSGNSNGRPDEWPQAANPLIDTATRKIVTLLGDPQQVMLPVLPPLLRVQMNGGLAAREQETFKWFAENNSTASERPPESHQALRPVQVGTPLPGLAHNPPGVR